jgi:opacity protein-like surface antigen
MKNLTCALALTAAILPITSIADTKNFEGFSGSLNLGLVSAALKLNDGADIADGFGGKQSFVAGVDLAYGAKMSDTGVITVGVEADLTQPEILTQNLGGTVLSAKQKNKFGLFLAPGTVVNKDTLLYGKLSYNSMKGQIIEDGVAWSDTYKGFGYGVGIKTMISPTVFVKVEVNRVSFGGETRDGWGILKPSGTTGVLGIGTSF